jgi:hypothetical protein
VEDWPDADTPEVAQSEGKPRLKIGSPGFGEIGWSQELILGPRLGGSLVLALPATCTVGCPVFGCKVRIPAHRRQTMVVAGLK